MIAPPAKPIDANTPLRGRFAPSPTGPLHFGSLVAAVGSYLDARARGGEWLVRMEDLDVPRTVAGADAAILQTLDRYGFEWQGELLRQSQRQSIYMDSLERLKSLGRVFPCACTRREVADSLANCQKGVIIPAGGELRYPGTCRNGLPPGRSGRSWRLTVGPAPIVFMDRLQGRQEQNLAEEIGDFVLLRADGLFAYQLAVVVDDAAQGITDVVRGADLLDSTPRQIYLQSCLGLPTPRYLHLPVAANSAGEKLSKQTLAKPLDLDRPQATLVAALNFLGQQAPADLADGSLVDVWRWALVHWDVAKIPPSRSLPAPTEDASARRLPDAGVRTE